MVEGDYTYRVTDHGMRTKTIERVVGTVSNNYEMKFLRTDEDDVVIKLSSIKSIDLMFVRKR